MYYTKPATQPKTFAEKHGELYRKLECGAIKPWEYESDIRKLNREGHINWKI